MHFMHPPKIVQIGWEHHVDFCVWKNRPLLLAKGVVDSAPTYPIWYIHQSHIHMSLKNVLVPWRYGYHSENIKFKHIFVIYSLIVSDVIALRWVQMGTTEVKSGSGNGRQATSHYPRQCWLSSLKQLCATRHQWFNGTDIFVNVLTQHQTLHPRDRHSNCLCTFPHRC